MDIKNDEKLKKTLDNININTDIFLYKDTAKAVELYFDYFKNNNDLCLLTKVSQIYNILKIITKNLSEIDINGISILELSNILLNSSSKEFYRLVDIFTYLVENNLMNQDISYTFNYIMPILKSPHGRKNLILEMLKLDMIEKVIIYKKVYECKEKYKANIINTENKNIILIVSEFIKHIGNSFSETSDLNSFFYDFGKSLGRHESSINSYFDFSYETFRKQVNYFKSNEIGLRFIIKFYIFIYNHNTELFNNTKEMNIKFLYNKNAINWIKNNFKLVYINPFDEVPSYDKWIIDTNGLDYSTALCESKCIQIDFTIINNPIYREFYKKFIWYSEQNLYTKTHMKTQIAYFFNFIDNLKNGKNLNILTYTCSKNPILISSTEIFIYKTGILNDIKNARTINSYLYNPRSILMFLNDRGILQISNDVFYHLTNIQDNNYNNSCSIPDDELLKLSNIMKEKSSESINNALYYATFYICLETEFRCSQILNLCIDCVYEANKPNQYVIRSKTKTTNGDIIEQSITSYVKANIDYILNITKPIRENCPIESLRKYLFLGESVRVNTFSKLEPSGFNSFLKKCCKAIGIKEYTSQNLRDTHITKAKEKIIREELSDVEQTILTGHMNTSTDYKFYIEQKVTEMLELTNETIIGNYDVKGHVLNLVSEEIAKDKNLVSNGCGYCNNTTCTDTTYLSCLMCKYFVATVDRIPFFEEEVKSIKYKLEDASIKHDKEDFQNIKNLLLNYLKLLYIKKEEIKNV